MTTEERVIAEIAEANPVPDAAPSSAQARAEAERVLRRVLADAGSAPPPRRSHPRLGILAPVLSLLVVVLVAAAILRTGGSSTSGERGTSGLSITLRAEPTPQTPRITEGAMSREIALMRRRLATLGHGFTVQQAGATGIVVTASNSHSGEQSRVLSLVTQPAQLRIYDWEPNVLTANGKTAAPQLQSQNRAAVSVSQGANRGAGAPGAGSMSLYDAVKLANRQPEERSGHDLSRVGPEYFVFGNGNAACGRVADALGTTHVPAVHCLLAGPVDPGSGAGPHQAVQEAAALFPSGRIPGRAEVVAVPQGTVVLQAEQVDAGAAVPISSPAAQFFVLRDHLALTGADITHPTASTDQAGEPAVTFSFTGPGQAAFERVTKAVSQRGAKVSVAGAEFNQHFAVALDDRLLTVPQIDFHQYPDGIIGAGGADVTGGLNPKSAKDLATELRYGALPLAVTVVR